MTTTEINNEPLGLENLGNTCFMNAALQCLSRTKRLIPKLELFGGGNKLVVVVDQVENDAQVTVINEGPINQDNDEEDTEKGSSDNQVNEKSSEKGQGDLDRTSFKIAITIPCDSMTGRLKHCFKAITKYQDASPGSESYSQRSFLSRGGGYYGYRPHEIHNMIAKHFRPGQQHDSHELLRTIVDFMKKDQTRAFRVAIMKHFGVAKNGDGSDPKMVELVKSLDQKVKHKTFIDEIFGGELMTTQTCLTCGFIKRSHEEFLDLSLPIRVYKQSKEQKPSTSTAVKTNPKKYSLFDEEENIVINRTVQECLQAFTEPALLSGSNVVECENCHKINLDKVAAGASFDEVFPNVKKIVEKNNQAESQSQGQNAHGKNKGGKNRESRKKKRGRNSKQRGQANNKIEETAEKEEPQPGPSKTCTTIALVENHYKHPSDIKNDEAHEDNKEKQLKINTQEQHEDLHEYVIISSGHTKPDANDLEQEPSIKISKEGCNNEEYDEIELPALISDAMEQDQTTPLIRKPSTESLDDIIKAAKSDEEVDEDDDSDLPPAIDGIGGSLSDGDEDNGVPSLDLPDLPSHDKFEHFKLVSDDEFDINNVSETEVEKGTTADEGFSEGENSASVENETQVQAGPNHGPSESSSRTSASDVFNYASDSDENNSKSSSSTNEGTVTTKSEELPKIPITKCPCSRQQNISRPPEFLTIHLKRFQISNRGCTSKVNEHVEFPMILDLTPFCLSPEDEQKIERRKDTIFDEDGQVMYSMYGIVEHSGSIHWGHYVAYVKVSPSCPTENTSDDSGLEKSTTNQQVDKWYHISDSHVSKSSVNSVKRQDPYILFYERIRGDAKKKLLAQHKVVEENSESSSSFSINNDVTNGWNDSPPEYSTKTDATSSWIGNWSDVQPQEDEDWDAPSTPAVAIVDENIMKGIPLAVNDTGTCVWENQPATTKQVWDEPDELSPDTTAPAPEEVAEKIIVSQPTDDSYEF